MKKSIFLLFIVFIFFSGCTSAKFEEMKAIPEEYENIYICFDSSQTIIGRGPSFSSGNGYFSYNSGWSHSTTLDTIENRNIAIKILTQRGYKVVSNIKEADIVLLGGYSSNEIRSKVSLAFLDAYTEELLFTTEGMYGMGWDINGDVRGALKNALKMQYLFYHQDLRGVTFQSYEKLLSSLSYDAIAFSALMDDQMDIIRKDSNFMVSLSYFKEVCPEMFFDTNVGNRASQKLKGIYKNSKMFSSQKKYVKSLYHSIQKIPQKEE